MSEKNLIFELNFRAAKNPFNKYLLMNKTIRISGFVTVLITVLFTATISAQDKKGAGGSVNIAYNIPQGKTLGYSVNSVITQQMDMEGQSIMVLVNNKLSYRAREAGKRDGNQLLEITVDTLTISVEAMGNSSGGNITEVTGKPFTITLAPSGKVIDISGAEKLEYSIEGQQGGNLGQTFRDIFPTLPARQVRPGEEWTDRDTVSSQTAGAKVFQIAESVNKYEGNETINGIQCAKITSVTTGTMETTTQSGGMDIYIHGPTSGQATVYFAIGSGYIVQQEVKTKLSGTIEISGPTNMSLPVIMDTSTRMVLR